MKKSRGILLLTILAVYKTGAKAETTGVPKAELNIKNNHAVVTRKGIVKLNIPLSPKKKIAENNFIEDRSNLLGNCLIIERGVNYIDGICAPGREKEIDLYTLDGRRQVFQPTAEGPYFRGPSFTHPLGQWGIIFNDTEGAEGSLSGFLLLKPDCSFITKKFDYGLLYPGDGLWAPEVRKDGNSALIVDYLNHIPKVSLVVQPDGRFEVIDSTWSESNESGLDILLAYAADPDARYGVILRVVKNLQNYSLDSIRLKVKPFLSKIAKSEDRFEREEAQKGLAEIARLESLAPK